MESLWSLYGVFTESLRSQYGVFIESLWSLYRVFTESLRSLYGVLTESLRSLYGVFICVVHLLSEGVPSREDTFLSWHLAPVSEVIEGIDGNI
jgi:hypothetical protein